ncbi:MAG: hypothetical protein WD066_18840 [Planctomycetaceae bacterium]
MRGTWTLLATAAIAVAVLVGSALIADEPNADWKAVARAVGNFRVVAAPDEWPRDVIVQDAEAARLRSAVFWTGAPLPRWASPCDITLRHKDHDGSGYTQFAFEPDKRGEVQVHGWAMTIEGRPERIKYAVLPHEVQHTVFASLFRRPLPRWLDEGAADLFVDEQDHRRLRELTKEAARSSYNLEPDRIEYHDDGRQTALLYASGFGMVEYLIAQKGKDSFFAFAKDPRPVSAKFDDHYGQSWDAAVADCKRWTLARPSACADCGCPMHAAAKPAEEVAASSGEPRAPPRSSQQQAAVEEPQKTRLWVFTAAWCAPCKAFRKDLDRGKWGRVLQRSEDGLKVETEQLVVTFYDVDTPFGRAKFRDVRSVLLKATGTSYPDSIPAFYVPGRSAMQIGYASLTGCWLIDAIKSAFTRTSEQLPRVEVVTPEVQLAIDLQEPEKYSRLKPVDDDEPVALGESSNEPLPVEAVEPAMESVPGE